MRGFSLAELMIALGLFAAISLFVIALITSAASSRAKGETAVLATHLAEQEMALAKALPYQDIAARLGTTTPAVTREVGGYSFDHTMTVEALAGAGLNPTGQVLVLTVQVDWEERTQLGEGGSRLARPASFRLRSLVAPGGTF